MWPEEKSSKGRTNGFYHFNQCSRDDIITLPLLSGLPPLLKDLLQYNGGERNNNFKKILYRLIILCYHLRQWGLM